MLSQDCRQRVARIFVLTNFDPSVSIARVDNVSLQEKGAWARCHLRGFAAPTVTIDSDQAWDFQGFHCTTTSGAKGVLETMSITGSFRGLYCMLSQQPKTFEDVVYVAKKCVGGSRNLCDIMFEVKCHAESVSLKSGGVEADERVCASLRVSHMKTSSEDRWCIPWELLQVKSMWIGERAVEDIGSTNFVTLD